MIVPKEKVEDVYAAVINDLQVWTNELYDLPAEEHYDLKFVHDKPWSGFSQYKGNGLSKIEINVDMPINVMRVVDLMAHEIYPGHHTENSIKDMKLIHGKDRQELNMILSLSPACVVVEGIAMHAKEIILDEDRYIHWLETKLLPTAGLTNLDAKSLVVIDKAFDQILGVGTNAAYLYWDEGLRSEDIKEYYLEYSLLPEKYADNYVDNWLPHPLYHIYSFAYLYGYRLLERLFNETGDPRVLFGQLLEETYLPDQVEALRINYQA
jgi:hypothetical protein